MSKRLLWLALCSLISCGGGGGGGSQGRSDVWLGDGPEAVRLEWQESLAREDGSFLGEVSGYKVYAQIIAESSSAQAVSRGAEQAIPVGDTSGVTLHGLSAGKHVFSVSVVDENGQESIPSAAVAITISPRL